MALSRQETIDTQAVVIDVFRGFRQELLEAFGNIEHTSKPDHSPVTVYDLKVETTLRDRLAEVFPEIGFEGEETGATGNRSTYWLVDPIDGTSSFIRGLPFCTNMAALVQDDVVIAAVIYDFVNDVLYTSLKGEGAYKNGVQMHVKEREPGNHFIYAMTHDKMGHIKEALSELHMRTLLPVGAAGHTYMMLAEGKIDGIVNLSRGKWLHDNAPGVMMCEEAGAVIVPYDGNTGVYRTQLIAGTPGVVDAIERSGLL